jgi:hypothetical protein
MILYIVTSFSHVSDIIKDVTLLKYVKDKSVLFLTSEFITKVELDKNKLASDYLENYIDPDEALQCDILICDLLKSWFIDLKGTDFTKFGEVSLGRAAMYMVYYRVFGSHFYQLCLSVLSYLKKFNVEKIIYEDSRVYEHNEGFREDAEVLKIISNHFDIEFDIVETTVISPEDIKIIDRDKKLPFSAKDSPSTIPTKSYKQKVKKYILKLRNLLHFNKNNSNYHVLATVYNPMKNYLDYAFSKKDDSISYCFFDSYYKKYLFVPKFDKYLPVSPYRVNLSKEYYNNFSNILNNFALLKKKYEYRKKYYTFCGIDFSEYFIPRVEKVIKQNFPIYISQVRRYESFLKKNTINVFFTAYDGPWFISLMVDLCKSMNIPTVELMDGPRTKGDAVSGLCDYVLCMSEIQRNNYFIDYLKRHNHSVIAVGSPLYNTYYHNFKTSSKAKIDKENIKVLIDGIGYGGKWSMQRKCDSDKYILEVLETLCKFENVSITIRYRDKERCVYYKWVIKNYFDKYNENIKFEDLGSSQFQDIISNYDIYITSTSGSIFEAALAAGKYCISYICNGTKMDPPFDGNSELMTARNPGELRRIVKDIMVEKVYTKEFNKKEVLEKYIGPLDNSNERIYNFLNKIMNKES